MCAVYTISFTTENPPPPPRHIPPFDRDLMDKTPTVTKIPLDRDPHEKVTPLVYPGGHGPPRPVKISHKKMAAEGDCIDIMFLGPPTWLLDPLLHSPPKKEHGTRHIYPPEGTRCQTARHEMTPYSCEQND